MTNTSMLNKRLESVIKAMHQRQAQQDVVISCYWGNEPLPENDGSILIRTRWGGGKVEDDDEYTDTQPTN